ncbi:MAG TPA: membrane dipeptidase [Alphaproteobacteria bacterium]|nr:membrane dipeptidase [Alphaproteobacteria bacterium]
MGTGETTRRRLMLGGSAACVAACLGMRSGRAQDRAAQARQVIADTITIDMHSHAGGFIRPRRTGSRGKPVSGPMRQGGLAVACLAIVADAPTHRLMSDHRIHPFRSPEAGELYAWTVASFRRLHDLIQQEDLALVTDMAKLRAARAGRPAAIIASEGGDFLDGRPDRVDEAYERWQLRHLQLVHYRPNDLGDIQTEPPVHDGLTDAGAEVIRRCNRRGVVVDVAHATFEVVKRAASVTTKPLILSHTALSNSPPYLSRLVSRDHARAVAATGGVVGVWPVFPDLRAMAENMARLADVIGADHVGLGSDQEGLPSIGAFPDYAQLPDLAEAMLATGFKPAEVGQLLGGNYRRVFEATVG